MPPKGTLSALAAIILSVLPVQAMLWPLPPIDSAHPIGHTWGNYINFGSGNLHPAVDIMTPDRPNPPVIAVAHGWVKAWGTTGGREFWNLAVSDSGPAHADRALGWLYAHVDPDLPHKNLGEQVAAGDTVGRVVNWAVPGFDHLHFARVSDTGLNWQRFPSPTWWHLENPLLKLEPAQDTIAPVFRDARPGERFAFCIDGSSDYLHPDSLRGNVDIVARIHDRTGLTSRTSWDTVAPYQLEYCIRHSNGAPAVPWKNSVQFSNLLERENVYVVYKYDNVCRSFGDYTRRDYFFIVTNTDGDSVIEAEDRQGCWTTDSFPDGDYLVLVRACDAVGNTTLDSMAAKVRSAGSVAEHRHLPVHARPRLDAATLGDAVVLKFSLSVAAAARLELLDLSGRVVEAPIKGRLKPDNYTVECHNLRPGVYIASLVVAGAEDRHKVVVTR